MAGGKLYLENGNKSLLAENQKIDDSAQCTYIYDR